MGEKTHPLTEHLEQVWHIVNALIHKSTMMTMMVKVKVTTKEEKVGEGNLL